MHQFLSDLVLSYLLLPSQEAKKRGRCLTWELGESGQGRRRAKTATLPWLPVRSSPRPWARLEGLHPACFFSRHRLPLPSAEQAASMSLSSTPARWPAQKWETNPSPASCSYQSSVSREDNTLGPDGPLSSSQRQGTHVCRPCRAKVTLWPWQAGRLCVLLDQVLT